MISLCSIGAVTVSTVAWFSTKDEINYVDGGAVASYFKSGHGTEQDPYIIASRNHVYNLAWLQYIGYFSDSTNFSGLHQYYFEVENDIDMEGLTIPPIGTEKYPFLGHFDGNGNTISNFTISNDDPEPDSSDFGVAKPINLYDGEIPDVVGFFGVVGELPNQSLSCDSSIINVSNVTLSDFTVKAKTSQVLIGLAAGYVNGEMSNVKVAGSATLDVNGQTSTAKTSITSKLSDYGLVGYTTRTGNDGNYQQKLSEVYKSAESGSGGQGENVGEGGSILIKDYTEWFYDMHFSGAYDTNSGRISTSIENIKTVSSGGVEQYKINFTAYGTFPSVSDLDASIYVRARCTAATARDIFDFYRDGTGNLKINTNNYSFTWSVNNSGTRNAADPENFAITFTGTNPTIGGTSRSSIYLNHTNSSKGSYYRMYTAASGTGTTNVIRAAANGVIENSGSTNINFSFIDNRNAKTYPDDYTDQDKANLYRLRDGAYLPLKFSDANRSGTSNGNTGYIIGSNIGSTNASPKLGSSSSDYPISVINNSLGGSTYNASNFEALTYAKYNGSWGWYGIGDSRNNNTKNSNLSSYTIVSAQNLGLKKYEYYNGLENASDTDVLARDAIHNNLSSSSYLFGLHFDGNKVDQTLDSSNFLTIPKAKISAWDDKTTLGVNEGLVDNLSVPKGSLDFHFGSTGYINFFAGSYVKYDGSVINTNFFSLYKVTRNSSTKAIQSIDEILEVYDNSASNSYTIANGAFNSSDFPSETNMKYAYKISDKDGTVSYLPSGFSAVTDKSDRLLFDVDAALRLKNETNKNAPVKSAMYYFEIPVNVGEYSMGLVSNGSTDSTTIQGAYMLYLDIGANSDVVEKDAVTAYSITTFSSANSYPIGVDFAPVTVSGDGGESIGVYIPSGSRGVLAFNVTTANIAITDSSEISTYSFLGTKYSESSPPSGNFSVSGNSPGELVDPSAFGTRVLSIQMTKSGVDYDIRVTDVLADANGAISSSTYEISTNGSGYASTTDTVINNLSTEIDLSVLRGLTTAVILTRTNGTGEFVTTYDVANSSYENKVVDVDIETNGSTMSVVITNGYTFKIDGSEVSNNSTYPSS